MKIVFDKHDLESLIREKYVGIVNIEIPEMEIKVEIDSSFLSSHVVKPISPPIKVETAEEKAERERKLGVMTSGGNIRAVQRLG